MTTFLAVAVAAAFGVAVYRFSPKKGELPFWPFHNLPHDRAFGTYDEQRLYRDLEAMRTHEIGEESVQFSKTGIEDHSTDTRQGPLAA
ncbi:hypothetical protein [Nocardia alba]|uniref:Uncharacterized protein n=1 Tax=Nocardia alba TaxID=225051 RepID=A0A4R1G2B2_9NOCA|nr:hypothetical protein [Nocardia alba]TCK00443.1 hypothetical protein DFR71_1443 [Nocardia alba]